MGQQKILFYSESWGIGGIETFTMNAIKSYAGRGVTIDVFSVHDSNDLCDNQIQQFGGHRFSVFRGEKPGLLKRLIYGLAHWSRLLEKGGYDIVHINAMNGTGFAYAAIAAMKGIPIRVVHSHNTAFGSGHAVIKKIVHLFSKLLFSWSCNSRIACSKPSGQYLFGRDPFVVLHNGVDTNRFQFNVESRKRVRKELSFKETDLVFGSIGRLSEAKNPLYQVAVLKQLRDMAVPAFLLLVGQGDMKSRILEHAAEEGVADYLRLPGNVHNTEDYYSALDVFTLPSLFEGYPMSIIEALANGLPVLSSDAIPTSSLDFVACGVRYLPIARNSTGLWASAIQDFNKKIDIALRSAASLSVQEAGFDSQRLCEQLQHVYSQVLIRGEKKE